MFISLVPQRVPWSSWMDSLHLVRANNPQQQQPSSLLSNSSKFVLNSCSLCRVSGFRMLEAFNLTEKTYSYVKGVSMETGSFNSYTAYRLHKNAYLTQPTTWVSTWLNFLSGRSFPCWVVDLTLTWMSWMEKLQKWSHSDLKLFCNWQTGGSLTQTCSKRQYVHILWSSW